MKGNPMMNLRQYLRRAALWHAVYWLTVFKSRCAQNATRWEMADKILSLLWQLIEAESLVQEVERINPQIVKVKKL